MQLCCINKNVQINFTKMKNMSNNQTLDEIIFEHRNKDYGAYLLRKTYKNNLQKSVFWGASIFLIGISAPFIYGKIAPKERVLEGPIINLKNLKQEETEVEKPKIEEKIEELEKVQVKSIAFPPPAPVVDDSEIIEEIPDQNDLNSAAISTVTQDGAPSTSILDESPPTISKNTDLDVVEEPKEDNSIHTFVEQQPEFGSGLSDLYEYLGKNLRYPSAAQRAGVQGKVFLSFVVERDGSISDAEVLKGIGFGCDEEALRVISSMPKWRPGRQNGRNVRVKFTVPVSFKLE